MMMTAEKNIWEQGEVASGNYHFRAQLIFLEDLGMSETTKRSNIHNSSLFAAEIYLGSVFSVSLLFTGLHHKLFSLPEQYDILNVRYPVTCQHTTMDTNS